MEPQEIQDAIDRMLGDAQTLNILCLQMERELTLKQWAQEYRDNARRAWSSINKEHKALTEKLEKLS